MTRLNFGRTKRRTIHPGSKQITIETGGAPVPEQDDIAGGRDRRSQGHQEFDDDREVITSTEKHREDKDRNHPGDDHRHAKIPLKPEGVPGRFSSWPSVGVNQIAFHRFVAERF